MDNVPNTCTAAGPQPTANLSSVIYFIGCDMGGWHTDEGTGGDGLAVCKWDGSDLSHVGEWCGRLFYPVKSYAPQLTGQASQNNVANFISSIAAVAEDQILDGLVSAMVAEKARIVIAIDAALAWPAEFVELVNKAPSAGHEAKFALGNAIDNPYLYRETERFIKAAVSLKKDPFTAPGAWFGNNSSKAQALVACFAQRLGGLYRPPFCPWDMQTARAAQYALIEVYPAASLKSTAFGNLKWPAAPQTMATVGNSDIADAKRCAMTGVCYAAKLGMLGQAAGNYPDVWLPGDQCNGISCNCALLQQEGWIFCPK